MMGDKGHWIFEDEKPMRWQISPMRPTIVTSATQNCGFATARTPLPLTAKIDCVAMVQENKRKSRIPHTPTRRLSRNVVIDSDYSDEGEGSGTPISHAEADLESIVQAFDVGNHERDVLLDLMGISGPLQASMVKVAPAIVGRKAEYDAEFFSEQVGLCNKGAMVDDVGIFYPHISDSDITKIWRVGNQANRFEIINCTDKEQARLFSKHCYEVYGHSLDNKYYSMRFLKGAFATFVHGLEVNWVAEVLHCRGRSIATALKNPCKLGPIALRRQVEGLCGIIRSMSTTSPSPPTLETLVDAAEKAAQLAAADEISAAEGLRALQKEKDDTEAVLRRCSTKDLGDAEAAATVAVLEQKRLFQSGTPADYKAPVEVVQSTAEKLADLQEAGMTARFIIDCLAEENGPLSMAVAVFKKARAVADAAFKKARMENLVLRPKSLFQYVHRQSVPPVGGVSSIDWCWMCSKGFVSGAAVLGSCSCLFHNTCVAEMIESKCHPWLFRGVDLDASWVAQWSGQLTPEQNCWMDQTVDLVKDVGATYPPAARN